MPFMKHTHIRTDVLIIGSGAAACGQHAPPEKPARMFF